MTSKKKKIRKLKKRLLKAERKVQTCLDRIGRLGKKLGKLEERISDLQHRLQTQETAEPILPGLGGFDLDASSDHISRHVLEKARYLRARYEFHLERNKPKPQAREEANEDLMNRFGVEAGLNGQDLEDVLS